MPVAKETLKLTTDTDGDDATVMVRGRTSLPADTWATPGDNPTRYSPSKLKTVEFDMETWPMMRWAMEAW